MFGHRNIPGKHLLRLTIFAGAAFAFIACSLASVGQTRGEESRRYDLRIENRRLVGDLKVIQVRRGDAVEINWTADRRTVLHLHGYDIETAVDAGASKVMSFSARATGRFPIEIHGEGGRHAVLIYLEVHPR
jgi:hypothetical protein